MDSLVDWFETTTLLGISLWSWLVAAAAALAAWLAMSVALGFALRRVQRAAGNTATRVDDFLIDMLSATNRGLMLLVALLVGVSMLDLRGPWTDRVSHLWFLAVALQVGIWGNRAIKAGLQGYVERTSTPGTTQVSASATLMSWGLNTALWAIVLLSILANVGVNITAFIASLGVGGIAVALAVQNILGDLFASVSIAVDKPFEVGDFIVVGTVAGTVMHIGVRSTRIRALSGEQIIMSNTELLKQTINNYKRLLERRIVFGFGVTYDTPIETVEEIPRVVERIVRANDKLRFDRAHLKSFGESALEYEVVYIVLDADYNLYMDCQQRINLELMRELERMGAAFAFPTRSLVMSSPVTVVSEREETAPERPAAPPRPDGGRATVPSWAGS